VLPCSYPASAMIASGINLVSAESFVEMSFLASTFSVCASYHLVLCDVSRFLNAICRLNSLICLISVMDKGNIWTLV
jgi:hypothetical protein